MDLNVPNCRICNVVGICIVIASFHASSILCQDDYGENPDAVRWEYANWPETTTIDTTTKIVNGCEDFGNLTLCVGDMVTKKYIKTIRLRPNIEELQLERTAMITVQWGDLYNFNSPKSLKILSNSNLTKIGPYAFKNMVHLVSIVMMGNLALTELDNDTFSGLQNLETLNLSNNGFKKILDITRSFQIVYMPKIKSISLNDNELSNITDSSFQGLQRVELEELNLERCAIKMISSDALSVFKTINYLRIGKNKLLQEQNIEEVFDQLIRSKTKVITLNLNNLKFEKTNLSLLNKINLLTVTHLVVSGTVLMKLSIEDRLTFPRMSSVEILDLRNSGVDDTSSAVLNPKVFPKLKTLLIGNNGLKAFPCNSSLSKLEVLDLSKKKLTTFKPVITLLPGNFKQLKSLISLDLSNNNILKIDPSFFKGLNKLKYLGLESTGITALDPSTFSTLKLVRLNLKNNKFHQIENIYPAFTRLKFLEYLDLEGCNISDEKDVQFLVHLRKLKYLNIQNNRLKTLNMLKNIPSIVGVNLTKNSIGIWNEEMLKRNTYLRVLDLRNNEISEFTHTMLKELSSFPLVDLSGNSFTCECKYFHGVVEFLKSKNGDIYDPIFSNPKHVCSNPPETKNKNIVDYIKESAFSCKFDEDTIRFGLLVSILIFPTIIVVSGIIFCLFRKSIRNRFVLIHLYIIRHITCIKSKRNENCYNYKYDAFVSYSNEDRDFVAALVNTLEKQPPHFKLCIYERDFEIGSILPETITDKVTASRKTILIVSNAFVKSSWCLWETQVAEYKRLSNGRFLDKHSLIIVKLDNIPNHNMPLVLKFLLKHRIYLDWDTNKETQHIFWEKLRCALAPVAFNDTLVNELNTCTTPALHM